MFHDMYRKTKIFFCFVLYCYYVLLSINYFVREMRIFPDCAVEVLDIKVAGK
jgi:hypothetical protein